MQSKPSKYERLKRTKSALQRITKRLRHHERLGRSQMALWNGNLVEIIGWVDSRKVDPRQSVLHPKSRIDLWRIRHVDQMTIVGASELTPLHPLQALAHIE